jgi:hypothetical protein
MDNPYGVLSLKANNYTIAESFTIRWLRASIEFDAEMEVTLVLRDKLAPNKRLRLICHHVTALNLESQLDYNKGLGYIMIYDISEFQILSCRYRVMESEDNGFDFYCRDIDIIEESN